MLLGNNNIKYRPHPSLHLTSRVAGPAQCPRIHKVHGASRPRHQGTGVSFGEGVVIAMGTVAASITIAERDGASITGLNHRQPHQD